MANVFRENISIIVTSLFGFLMGDIYSSKCKMLLDLGDTKITFDRIMRNRKKNEGPLATRKVYEAYTTTLLLVFKISLIVILDKS